MALVPPTSVGGSSSGGLTEVFNSTLAAPAASFDITSIASGGHALQIWLQIRSSVAATSDTYTVRFNGDSGANYDNQENWGSQGATANASSTGLFAQTFVIGGTCVGDTATAGVATLCEILVPAYDGTTLWKQAFVRSQARAVTSGAGYILEHWGSNWRNTAAITRVTIAPVTGPNWITGCSCRAVLL